MEKINDNLVDSIGAIAYTAGVLESAILKCKSELSTTEDSKQRSKIEARIEVLKKALIYVLTKISYTEDEIRKVIDKLIVTSVDVLKIELDDPKEHT